jgi:hypothetical protein
MDLIKPTLQDKMNPLEELREELVDNLGELEYYEKLEEQVKEKHSDLFEFMRDYPSFYPGYSVISEIYQLEETIMNLKVWMLNKECHDDFYVTRSVRTKPE